LVYKGFEAFSNGKIATFDIYKIDAGRYISLTASKKGMEILAKSYGWGYTLQERLHIRDKIGKYWTPQLEQGVSKLLLPIFTRFSLQKIPKLDFDKLLEDCSRIVIDSLIIDSEKNDGLTLINNQIDL
jgi:hypothetical protein